METLRKRATAIIIKDNEILFIKRIRAGIEYYIFPGGGVDAGETIEDAIIREVKEELCLEVKSCELLFSIENVNVPQISTIHKGNRDEYVFRIIEYEGIPEIGGPEKERMTPENQYHIVWIPVTKITKIKNTYPEVIVQKLADLFVK